AACPVSASYPPPIPHPSRRTFPHKTVTDRHDGDGRQRLAGKHCRSFVSPRVVPARTNEARQNAVRSNQMTVTDEIETDEKSDEPSLGRAALSGMAKLILFLLIQGLAVLMVGIVALFFTFEAAWSAEGPFVKPSDARSGSLLVKSDDGYTEAIRLGVDVDLTVS